MEFIIACFRSLYVFYLSEVQPLMGRTQSFKLFFHSPPHAPPSLNRFALMENAAMHLSSGLMSATPSAMDTG